MAKPPPKLKNENISVTKKNFSLLSSIKGSCVFGRNKVGNNVVTDPSSQSMKITTIHLQTKNLDFLFMKLTLLV